MTSDAQAELGLGIGCISRYDGRRFLAIFVFSVAPEGSENEIEAMQLALDPDANLQPIDVQSILLLLE